MRATIKPYSSTVKLQPISCPISQSANTGHALSASSGPEMNSDGELAIHRIVPFHLGIECPFTERSDSRGR
jgi:hypothetical protein